MMRCEALDGNRVWVVHGFLSPEECAGLIRRSESLGYERGTIGDFVLEDVRNNDRVILDDPALAADLFERARPFLPATDEDDPLAGFNERFRFYRYDPGQTFKPHRDGSFTRFEPWVESRLTFMVYLNAGAEGGETKFFTDMKAAFARQPYLVVRPEEGMALVFIHRVWHEGAVVRGGRKYALRTDVMYARETNG